MTNDQEFLPGTVSQISRRAFLAQTTALAAAALLPAPAAESAPHEFIDCNIWLGESPFRQLPWNSVTVIAEQLRARGVTSAWAASFEALFHHDLAQVNRNLAKICREIGDGLFLPFGAIDPRLPDWAEDVKRCAGELGMRGIRLLPNYHGFTLDSPEFLRVLELAAHHGLLVQITAQFEDERTQHPLVHVAPVALKPLAKAMTAVPEARVMVLNANAVALVTSLQGSKALIDFAMVEGVGGVESLLQQQWPLEQIVFGSFAPQFYWEAARLKLQESELSTAQLAAIMHGNAARIIGSLPSR